MIALVAALALASSGFAQVAPSSYERWDDGVAGVLTLQAQLEQMDHGRALTPGEIALAKPVFRDGLDLSAVRVHYRKWWPLQPSTAAITPNGSIYFSNDFPCSDDFSDDAKLRYHLYSALFCRRVFVHELAHAYQHAQGIHVVARRLSEKTEYRYVADPSRSLNDYTLEQQAEIIADYYERVQNRAPLAELEPVLRKFLADPKYLRADEIERRRRAAEQDPEGN